MDNTVTDMLGKPLNVDDYVVFTNNIYQVKNLGKQVGKFNRYRGAIGIMLINPSPTTKIVKKDPRLMVKLHPGDVLFKLLKQ